MKKIVLIAITTLLTICANAQQIVDDFVSESKVVRFQETKGDLLKKETFYTKSINGLRGFISITPAMITDLRSGDKEAYIIVKTQTLLANDGVYSSTIDFDELPACIEALDYIIQHEITQKYSYDVEVCIRTRDWLMVGASYAGKMNTWETTLVHDKYVTNPAVTVSISRIKDILEEFVSARSLLEEKIKN